MSQEGALDKEPFSSPMEKMRIRVAAEGYRSLNDEEEKGGDGKNIH